MCGSGERMVGGRGVSVPVGDKLSFCFLFKIDLFLFFKLILNGESKGTGHSWRRKNMNCFNSHFKKMTVETNFVYLLFLSCKISVILFMLICLKIILDEELLKKFLLFNSFHIYIFCF